MLHARIPARSRRFLGLMALFIFGIVNLACVSVRPYVWTKMDVDPREKTVVGTLEGVRVNLVNDQSSQEQLVVGAFITSLRQITEDITTQLSSELQSRKAITEQDAPMFLKIKAEKITFQPGMWTIGAKMRVQVEAGNGYFRFIDVETATPGGIPRLLDGAIQIAVTEILKDAKIADYLSH